MWLCNVVTLSLAEGGMPKLAGLASKSAARASERRRKMPTRRSDDDDTDGFFFFFIFLFAAAGFATLPPLPLELFVFALMR